MSMEIEKLTLENLPLVDGGSVAIAFNRALEQAYHDCRDRPHMKAKRTVTLKVELTPDAEFQQGSELERAIAHFEIASKCPAKGVNQAVRCVPKQAGFGFFRDTNNTKHLPNQQSFEYNEDED